MILIFLLNVLDLFDFVIFFPRAFPEFIDIKLETIGWDAGLELPINVVSLVSILMVIFLEVELLVVFETNLVLV